MKLPSRRRSYLTAFNRPGQAATHHRLLSLERMEERRLLANFGFETPAVGDGVSVTTGVPDWDFGYYDVTAPTTWVSFEGDSGVWNPDASNGFTSGAAFAGKNAAWAETTAGRDTGLSQVLSASLEANTEYVLSVQVGNPLSNGGATADYRIELLAGGVLLESDTGVSPGSDTWALHSLTYDSGPSPAQLDESLEIRLVAADFTSGSRVDFDEVSLMTTVDVPNPGFEYRGVYDPIPEGQHKYPRPGDESWRYFEAGGNGGPARIVNPPTDFVATAAEGDYLVRVVTDPRPWVLTIQEIAGVAQILSEPFDPNRTYELTAQVSRYTNNTSEPDNYWNGYVVQLAVGGENHTPGGQLSGQVIGGTVIAEDWNTESVPFGTWVTSTVSYTPNPGDADLAGQPLQIRLLAIRDPNEPDQSDCTSSSCMDFSYAKYAAFDDVQLTEVVAGDTPTPQLMVTTLLPSSAGFTAQFNRDLDAGVLNLYDQEGAPAPADVTLVGTTVGPVAGSLVIDPTTRQVTFVKTGGPLASDEYTVTLRSSNDGFQDTDGSLLDGDVDGQAGGDYVTTFTVIDGPVVVGLPDFTRGPGQQVDVPANGNGLLLSLTDDRGAANGIESVVVKIQYDPALLNISSAELGPDAPAGATFSAVTGTPGLVTLSFSSPGAPLFDGTFQFVRLIANVPASASYKGSNLLDLYDLQVTDSAAAPVAAKADDALHAVAYLGDATGNEEYSGLDSQRVARVSVGLDSGFDVYSLIDPTIIGDATGNGNLSGLDAQRIAQEAVGLDPWEIAPIPQAVRLADPSSRSRQSFEGDKATVFGWFNGTTPRDDVEFVHLREPHELVTLACGYASDRADLLGVVVPQLGPLPGHNTSNGGVTADTSPLGMRRVWDEESLFDDAVDLSEALHAADLAPTAVDGYFAKK